MLENNATMWENSITTRAEAIFDRQDILSKRNKVLISGEIGEELSYSHMLVGKKIYKSMVQVERGSGNIDFIPIKVSEAIIPDISTQTLNGKYVEICGQFQSESYYGEDGKRHLELFVFVTAINIYESSYEMKENNLNWIFLEGRVCQIPIYRETPLGRAISELMLKVSRKYSREDYIPCIAWGELARDAACQLKFNNRVTLYGRIQSRKYLKRYSPDSDEGVYKMAYEISIVRMAKMV